MNKFLHLIGIAFFAIAILNGVQSRFAWGDEIVDEYAHVFCPGTATCDARSSNGANAPPAACTSTPEPCGVYNGPNGLTCSCNFAPGSTTICQCYAN